MLFLIRVSVHWCYKRRSFHTREHGQSTLKLPPMAATLEALHSKLLLKCSYTCDFIPNMYSRLCVFHSAICNTILCKSGEDSLL